MTVLLEKAETIIRNLINANFAVVNHADYFQYTIPYGIGFIICRSETSLNNDDAVSTLFNAILNHDKFPIEKPMVLSQDEMDSAIRIHRAMQEEARSNKDTPVEFEKILKDKFWELLA